VYIEAFEYVQTQSIGLCTAFSFSGPGIVEKRFHFEDFSDFSTKAEKDLYRHGGKAHLDSSIDFLFI
jgi:hypothetical protein